jgi:hypothetical protein
LEAMMVSSQTYAENGDAAVNLKLEAMKGLFDGTKQLFINADDGKPNHQAIKFAEIGCQVSNCWCGRIRLSNQIYEVGMYRF